jgi:hypothetical protein
MNFVVTQFTSYYNERSKHSSNKECDEHLFPKDSRPATDVEYSALPFVAFGGLLAICVSMVYGENKRVFLYSVSETKTVKRLGHILYTWCQNRQFLSSLQPSLLGSPVFCEPCKNITKIIKQSYCIVVNITICISFNHIRLFNNHARS